MFDVPLDRGLASALLGADAGAATDALRAPLRSALAHAPAVAAAATAARRSPMVSAELEVVARALRLEARIWIGEALLAVVERRPADAPATHVLVVADVDAFPRLIAALVELGPRPRPIEPGFPLPAGGLELIGGALDRAARREVVRALKGTGPTADLSAALDPDTRRWVLATAPGAELDSPCSTVDVVDAPRRGLWLVHGTDDDGATLFAADPTVVWTLISGLVDGALLVASAPEGFILDEVTDVDE